MFNQKLSEESDSKAKGAEKFSATAKFLIAKLMDAYFPYCIMAHILLLSMALLLLWDTIYIFQLSTDELPSRHVQ